MCNTCVLYQIGERTAARKSSFTIYDGGYSSLAYVYRTEPGLTVESQRHLWRNVDADKTQTFSLELANLGFFPVARGEISLSLAMTDDDITSFIEAVKEIVVEMDS